MDRHALVEADLKTGKALIKALDAASFDVAAAFWLRDSEQNVWKLIVATKAVEQDIHDAYVKLGEILARQETLAKHMTLSDVRLVKPKDPIVVKLRKAVPLKGIGEKRWTYGTIDGTLVEDAVIYRTAA